MELTSLRFATAIVRDASLVTYLADLQLGGSPALLNGVAIAHHITAIAADDVVLVALPPADMPAPAPLVVAVIKGSSEHVALTLGDAAIQAVLDLSGQALALDSQAANTALRGPVSGAAAGPTFRAAVMADKPASVGVRVYNNAAFTHNSTGNWVAITFDSETNDDNPDGGQHSTVSNTSRLTAQTAGIYVISGAIVWAGNATGRRSLAIRSGGASYLGITEVIALDANAFGQSVATVFKMAVSDYVELMALQASGGDLNILRAAAYSPEFAMVLAR